jgi:phenylalanyl-tRNA synthetase beta chain
MGMRVTWNWLAEFVDLQAAVAEVAEVLTMGGLEVESIEDTGRELADVVCAEIVRVQPHPNADRLSVCDVRTGSEATWTVVCGAANVRAGNRVAYAPPGATLPGGRSIATTEVRGTSSAGMLCAAAELGIGAEGPGILVLPDDAPLGERVSAILALEDTVLDIAITPNRGDCLSVLGIAREIIALTGQRPRRQRLSVQESGTPAAEMAAVRIADPELCGRYVARLLWDVPIAASPLWMQSRLQAVGLRPINNMVDVTNYVMVERGQPLHAFDYDRLPSTEILVRRADADNTFTTLDGQTRPLHPDDLLITSGGQPVAIAGVMGGAETEVTPSTGRILLESAWFAPATVRGTAKRLGLRSEASYRFERMTDIEGVPAAADRAAALMAKLANATVAQGRIDVYPGARQRVPISLRLKRVDDLLGMPVNRTEVVSRLKALGIAVSPATRGTLTAVPPSYRSDLRREIDLIEEIARLGGYQNVPTTLPQCILTGTGEPPEYRRQRDLRRFCTALGLNEVVFLSFCSPRLNALFPGLHDSQRQPVRVLNPLTQDDTELRLSLLPGLVRIVRDNLDQGVSRVALFCIGKVFWSAESFAEARRLAGAICPAVPSVGVGSRAAVAQFADVKGILESLFGFVMLPDVQWKPAAGVVALHPGKTARIEVAGEPIGVLGSLHPALAEEMKLQDPCWLFEVDLDRLLEYSPPRTTYRELSRFPAVLRDVAIVTDESFASDRVVQFVREWNQRSQLIEDVYLFDRYAGPPIPPGKKSLAYSLSYRAADRTLTDAEVNAAHGQLIAALKDALHVETR